MKLSPNITAIILLAGSGTRANLGYNKILHPLHDSSVAVASVSKFLRFNKVIVVCAEPDLDNLRNILTFENVSFVLGGATRSDSVRNALNSIDSTDIVIIHDGARPFVSAEIIDDCIDKAINFGSGVSAFMSTNALRILSGNTSSALDRDMVAVVQTPQAFDFTKLCQAYSLIGGSFADDSEVFEKAGFNVTLSLGSPDNIKLTTPTDFLGLGGGYKVGFGFDVHPFKNGRALVLLGEKYDTSYGLDGHSDADAPTHAVMDALLSACNLPDIGVLFPDTDNAYKDANSLELLKQVVARCNDYKIINVSVCIIAQKPKIAPHREAMQRNLARVLNISQDCVNISATTTEFLGIIGEEKGLASAVDILVRKL